MTEWAAPAEPGGATLKAELAGAAPSPPDCKPREGIFQLDRAKPSSLGEGEPAGGLGPDRSSTEP